jgi:PKD repeat protein
MQSIMGKTALGVVVGLALWLAGPFVGGSGVAAPAFACGLGQPQTMTANGQAAVTFPTTPTTPANAPQGVFAQQFAVNQAITLTEDLSRIPPPGIKTSDYQWNWDFGDGKTGSGYSITHTYTKAGTFTIKLHLVAPKDPTESDTNFDSASITITDQQFPNPPTAQITSSDEYVQLGSSLMYSAAGSQSPDGSPLTYTWNFNDTTPVQTGMQVTHTFQVTLGFQSQTFVALIVQDASGARTVATIPVVVARALPQAALSANATNVAIGQTITFDASNSQPIASVQGDTLTKYQWFFGDGDTETTTSPTISHSFAHTGNYTVKVHAIDTQNLAGSATLHITVSNPGLFGLGPRAPIILGGGGVIAFFLLLGIVGNVARERREAQQRLALEAARKARRREAARAAYREPLPRDRRSRVDDWDD